jgi:hypothetical protein
MRLIKVNLADPVSQTFYASGISSLADLTFYGFLAQARFLSWITSLITNKVQAEVAA